MRRPRFAAVVAVLVGLGALGALGGPASAWPQKHAHRGFESAPGRNGLNVARGATAAFHNPDKAIAAGYIPTDECVADPQLGVMGQHWVNPALFTTDPTSLRPEAPQALLYVPTRGGVRLVAVEYIVFAPTLQPASDPGQVDPNGPALFGQHFNGPMAGHAPGMPVHWDLHVWVWAHNPAGMFAQFNPALSC